MYERAGRRQREVLAAVGAFERPRRAAERPRDHAADGVLARHDLARGGAGRIELGGRDLVDVRGDLQHRVRRGVDDQVAGREVLRAEVVDHRGAAVGPVAQDAAAGAVDQLVEDLVREAVRVRAQRARRDDAHQLPVAGDRVLARPERVQPPVDDAVRRRRHARQRHDVAEPEALQDRQVEPAGGLGDVAERVRARVAVVGRVGQLARPAGVDDDDEGSLHGCRLWQPRSPASQARAGPPRALGRRGGRRAGSATRQVPAAEAGTRAGVAPARRGAAHDGARRDRGERQRSFARGWASK